MVGMETDLPDRQWDCNPACRDKVNAKLVS